MLMTRLIAIHRRNQNRFNRFLIRCSAPPFRISAPFITYVFRSTLISWYTRHHPLSPTTLRALSHSLSHRSVVNTHFIHTRSASATTTPSPAYPYLSFTLFPPCAIPPSTPFPSHYPPYPMDARVLRLLWLSVLYATSRCSLGHQNVVPSCTVYTLVAVGRRARTLCRK